MIDRKTSLEYLIRSLFYSFIVFFIDAILIIIINLGMNQIGETLSFLLLVEGGICLVVGGAVALYSPSVGKINEILFHSKPWNAKRQKEIEKHMGVIIITGTFLIIEALLLSAI